MKFNSHLLLLISAVLLAGCTQSSDAPSSTVTTGTTVTQPVASSLGQVYAIGFQNVSGTGQVQSSVQRLGTGLTSQALSDVTGPLGFTLVGTDTFVVNGVRHVKAVYKVTNNTGARIANLALVPTNTDPDGSGTTPATTPTVGSTYFKDLYTYGGTDASGRATSLTPVVGKVLSSSQGASITDSEATPFTAVDTSALHPTAGTGLIVNGLSTSGWVSSIALEARASTNITVAADLTTATAATDPFQFSVVVTTADNGSTTTTDTTAPSVSLSASPTTLTAAGNVTLTATASDNVGVSSVKFYRGTTLLGTVTTAPYTYTDAVSSSGTYSYTAVASDAAGNSTTSSAATVTATISTGTTSGGISAGTSAAVLTAANAFLATLSTTQQASVVLSRTQALAINWSNLPCGSSCRNGILFSTLSSTQLTAAKAVVKAALGTTSNEGYDEAMQILAADDVLGSQRTGYSSGNYYLAFLNTPTASGIWQLQFGGHHLAVNITYNNGVITGTTPYFEGVEPKCWSVTGTTTTANNCTAPGTSGSTTTYAPLYQEQAGMAAMLASLSTTQLATAKLSTTFSDVLLGPKTDGQFPATKQGLAVSTLTDAQKLLVLAAMKPWVQDVDDTTAAALLSIYQNELNSTYIAFSGNAALSTNADYVRIDGPSVWIEFVCQTGVVYSSQIHYHSVWRDHTRDYGATYTF